jgi:hypothetical protein
MREPPFVTAPRPDPESDSAPGFDAADPDGADAPFDRLAADWVTIWQSELAALAADRESAEHMRAAMAVWVAATAALRQHDRAAPGSRPRGPAAGSDAPSRTASASAASDAGDTIARLEQRVAELERRLAAS